MLCPRQNCFGTFPLDDAVVGFITQTLVPPKIRKVISASQTRVADDLVNVRAGISRRSGSSRTAFRHSRGYSRNSVRLFPRRAGSYPESKQISENIRYGKVCRKPQIEAHAHWQERFFDRKRSGKTRGRRARYLRVPPCSSRHPYQPTRYSKEAAVQV